MQSLTAASSQHQTEYPLQQQTAVHPGQHQPAEIPFSPPHLGQVVTCQPQLSVQTYMQGHQLHQPQPQQQQAYAPVTTQPFLSPPELLQVNQAFAQPGTPYQHVPMQQAFPGAPHAPGTGHPQLQSQPRSAPVATTAATRAEAVRQAAAAVEQAANAGMQKELFADPDMKFCRFPDVRVNPQYLGVEKGELHAEPGRINGHLVAPNTIAMQAPLAGHRLLYDFYCVMQSQDVGLILDLTQECDRTNHKILYSGVTYVSVGRPDQSTSNAVIRIGEATSERWGTDVEVSKNSFLARICYRMEAHQYDDDLPDIPTSEYSAEYLNFPIRDFGSASATNIGLLVNKLKEWRNANSGKKVAVHCTAGVGRSGTVIAAEQLREKFDAGLLNHQNLSSTLAAIIIDIRNRRSPSMVQSPEQFRCLIEYGMGLLEGTMQ
jgi:protein tyrosine phosphatase